MSRLPALSVIGAPSKRAAVLELAAEADRRGFPALAVPWIGGGTMAMCTSLAHVTARCTFSSSIQPIYMSQPIEIATTAAHIHEISRGRFRLGLGVSHSPVLDRMGVTTGKPLADVRDYVAAVRKAIPDSDLPLPIVLAALRDRMLDLALEIADGAVWANASKAHTPAQVARVPADRRDSFELANMVPTVINDDLDAARAIHRRTLAGYIGLPNYRNYWRTIGFVEEMDAIEAALQARDRAAATAAMSDRWVDDCTISGSPSTVRDQLDAWYDVGVTPIAVMSSTSGGQAQAIRELFDVYD